VHPARVLVEAGDLVAEQVLDVVADPVVEQAREVAAGQLDVAALRAAGELVGGQPGDLPAAGVDDRGAPGGDVRLPQRGQQATSTAAPRTSIG
jgi:hypothetical protein